MGVASLAKEALFGLSFYDPLSHKIYLIRSPSLSMKGEVTGALCSLHADRALERLLSSSG